MSIIIFIALILSIVGNLFLFSKLRQAQLRVTDRENAMADELANADLVYKEFEKEIKKLKQDLSDSHVSLEIVLDD